MGGMKALGPDGHDWESFILNVTGIHLLPLSVCCGNKSHPRNTLNHLCRAKKTHKHANFNKYAVDDHINVPYHTMHFSKKIKKVGGKGHLKETKLTCLVFLSLSPAPLPAILDCCQGNPIRNVSTWLTNDSSHQLPFFLCRIELLYGWMEGGIKQEAITFLPHVHAYSHMITRTHVCAHTHISITHLYV